MSTKLSGYNKKAIFYANHIGIITATTKKCIKIRSTTILFRAFFCCPSKNKKISIFFYQSTKLAYVVRKKRERDCRIAFIGGVLYNKLKSRVSKSNNNVV